MPEESRQEAVCGDVSSLEGIREPCAVFPVRSGGPMIGLGLLLLLFALLPAILGTTSIAFPAAILFGGFGLFCIWLGLTR